LSRTRVHVLKAITPPDTQQLLGAAMHDVERGLGGMNLHLDDAARVLIANAADGDARRALTLLEVASDLSEQGIITEACAQRAIGDAYRRFDKHGELHNDQISALHKTIRNSHPDAALYWLCRMLDGGVDPGFIARRLTRAASEDIGNADPRALPLAIAAWQSYERLGAPEGELALAQLTVYLACAPKSNASYLAWKAVQAWVQTHGTDDVPNHLRNAPTQLMKSLGYAKNYQYDHDFEHAFAPGQYGFPEAFDQSTMFYQPVPRGLEIKIAEKLAWLRAQRMPPES
jgi:putative ATPase